MGLTVPRLVHRARRSVISARLQRAFAEPVRAFAHNLLVFALESGTHVEDELRLFRSLILGKRVSSDSVTERWFRGWKRRRPKTVRIPRPSAEIERNLDLLHELFGLTRVELDLVFFLAVLHSLSAMRAIIGAVTSLETCEELELYAAATDIDPAAVKAALAWDGRLVGTGLIQYEDNELGFLDGVRELLLVPNLTATRLVERTLPQSEAPTLSLDDFAALGESARTTLALVSSARRARQPGINVLLYGPTGTGKTEFARLVARETGLKLYVAGAFDDKGEAPEARRRLGSLLLGNRLFATADALLLFDELEDLFEWDGRDGGKARMSKQWFNRMLETNAVPTIWITNETYGIDPAFLRRFSFAIEFRPPGARHRARILSRHLGENALSQKEVDAIAQRFEVAPAQIKTAVTAARLVAPQVDRATLERFIAPVDELVRGAHGSALAAFDIAKYRVDVLNASEDLATLADRLASGHQGAVSLCFHGPPGTGKSEYARWLAWRMDRPIVCRRVSDMESCWVGETEKNIRAAFREAQAEGAVLLFDEADSWLRDRRTALRSWEVTQVNEFLQQLESHQGIVICTTNLWSDLDQASLRRFVFKVEFRYLTVDAASRLFDSMFGADDVRSRLERLPPLTPGDFAVVARRLRVLDVGAGAGDILLQLEAEALARKTAHRPAGFAR